MTEKLALKNQLRKEGVVPAAYHTWLDNSECIPDFTTLELFVKQVRFLNTLGIKRADYMVAQHPWILELSESQISEKFDILIEESLGQISTPYFVYQHPKVLQFKDSAMKALKLIDYTEIELLQLLNRTDIGFGGRLKHSGNLLLQISSVSVESLINKLHQHFTNSQLRKMINLAPIVLTLKDEEKENYFINHMVSLKKLFYAIGFTPEKWLIHRSILITNNNEIHSTIRLLQKENKLNLLSKCLKEKDFLWKFNMANFILSQIHLNDFTSSDDATVNYHMFGLEEELCLNQFNYKPLFELKQFIERVMEFNPNISIDFTQLEHSSPYTTTPDYDILSGFFHVVSTIGRYATFLFFNQQLSKDTTQKMSIEDFLIVSKNTETLSNIHTGKNSDHFNKENTFYSYIQLKYSYLHREEELKLWFKTCHTLQLSKSKIWILTHVFSVSVGSTTSLTLHELEKLSKYSNIQLLAILSECIKHKKTINFQDFAKQCAKPLIQPLQINDFITIPNIRHMIKGMKLSSYRQ
jgi:hypothetical protein